MAAPKGPQHDPARSYFYTSIIRPDKEGNLKPFRSGKTREDSLPARERPRVRYAALQYAPDERAAYLTEQGFDRERIDELCKLPIRRERDVLVRNPAVVRP